MPNKNGYAAIWDMDGTLVDTAELHFEAWAATARERGRPFSRDDFANTFGRRNPEILHILFGDAVAGEEALDLADRKELLYRKAAEQGVVLLPGVRALLEDLDRAGFRQAIGSSAAARQSRTHSTSDWRGAILPGGRGDGRHPARQARSAGVPIGGPAPWHSARTLCGIGRRGGGRPGGEGRRNEVHRGSLCWSSLRGGLARAGADLVAPTLEQTSARNRAATVRGLNKPRIAPITRIRQMPIAH